MPATTEAAASYLIQPTPTVPHQISPTLSANAFPPLPPWPAAWQDVTIIVNHNMIAAAPESTPQVHTFQPRPASHKAHNKSQARKVLKMSETPQQVTPASNRGNTRRGRGSAKVVFAANSNNAMHRSCGLFGNRFEADNEQPGDLGEGQRGKQTEEQGEVKVGVRLFNGQVRTHWNIDL